MSLNTKVRSRVIEVLLTAALAASVPAFANETHEFNVPAETAAQAIRDFASQARVQILVADDNVKDKRLSAVKGEYSTDQGLRILLADSGLKPRYVGDHSIALVALAQTESVVSQSTDGAKEVEKSDSFRMAPVDQGSPSSSGTSVDPAKASDSIKLDEIVVTAQKREERLQDVPVPVSALNAEVLLAQNQVSLKDYYSSIPGLNYTPDDPNGGTFTIRGLNSGGGNPTVAVLVDGIPFGSTTATGNGFAIPDLDPGNLERIEVLRGPQGTLYGASSIGGLINFVTAEPSTARVTGRVQADLASVYAGDGPGYGVRGAMNVPLGDTLAVRASAFARHDPGYVDNLQTGQRGVNWGNTDGAMLSALWRPSDALSLRLSALLQNSDVHGNPAVFLISGYGDLQQNYLRDSGWGHANNQAYSATLKAKLGAFELTSVSAYNVNRLDNSTDASLSNSGQDKYFQTSAVNQIYTTEADKFTQELRLSTRFGRTVDWFFGGFYTHERSPESAVEYAANASTGALLGNLITYGWSSTYAEYAAFTDVTLHFTDRFDIQLGGRESINTQRYHEADFGPDEFDYYNVQSPAVYPEEATRQKSFTYLVTPRFRLSDDFMIYARLASGYRPGGPNFNDFGNDRGVPTSFGPDTTKNYEIGFKGDALARKITFDASLYYIDWKNIQLNLLDPHNNLYFGNAGGARSRGVEISLESRPLRGLTLGGWVTWSEAELTEGFPLGSAAYGVPGDPLPFSSRFSGNLAVQEEFSLRGGWMGFAGGALSYVGDRLGFFRGSPPSISPRQNLPPYAKTDLHAGAKYQEWTLSLFANNVTDRRGILSGGAGSPDPRAFFLIQPRTIGLSVVRVF